MCLLDYATYKNSNIPSTICAIRRFRLIKAFLPSLWSDELSSSPGWVSIDPVSAEGEPSYNRSIQLDSFFHTEQIASFPTYSDSESPYLLHIGGTPNEYYILNYANKYTLRICQKLDLLDCLIELN